MEKKGNSCPLQFLPVTIYRGGGAGGAGGGEEEGGNTYNVYNKNGPSDQWHLVYSDRLYIVSVPVVVVVVALPIG